MDEIVTTPPRRPPGCRAKSRDQRLRRLKSALLRAAPHLGDEKFAPIVVSFARITLLAGDSGEFLRQHGLVGENGELRSSVDTVNRLVGTQLKLAAALGLTPTTLRSIAKERSVDAFEIAREEINETESR